MTAWKTCVARHPNLRNKIVDEKISLASTFSTPTFLTDQNIAELFTRISNEFVPLDREPAPNDLFLVQNGKTLYFMVRMLHSLTDGTSLNIIFNDFMKFYEQRMTTVDSLQFLPQPLNYEDPDENLKNKKGWFHLMFTICPNSNPSYIIYHTFFTSHKIIYNILFNPSTPDILLASTPDVEFLDKSI